MYSYSPTLRLRLLALASVLVACGRPIAPAPAPTSGGPPSTLRLPAPLTSLREHRVVPAPLSVLPRAGAPFTLSARTVILAPAGDSEVARIASGLATMLRPATGFPLLASPPDTLARGTIISLVLGGDNSLGDEGYELDVDSVSVRLTALRPAGLFRGTQTLRQLLPAGIEAQQSSIRMAPGWTIPPGHISDRPRFGWRGGMLDVARHFFTVDEVKQYVDLLALYKLNILHLHLSDDQGWRVQIDGWPRLATVGGSSEVGGGAGGYYSKAEYAELVRYAAARYITVVPEIDMPAHVNAAVAAYPELGCGRAVPSPSPNAAMPALYTGIRVGWSALCVTKDSTWRFIDDVVREIAALTPGPYFHMGGDEVQVLTREQYVTFVERVQDIVAKYGKTLVGWEEIGRARLRPGSIAQQWQSDTAVLAVRQGAKVILSPGPKTYLDMRYTPETLLGLNWAGFIELRTAYDWDPATYLPSVHEENVAGVEAPLWTETVKNMTAAEYLLLPRLPAIAEVGWSPQPGREWARFAERIAAHGARWQLLGVNYYASPQVMWERAR